MEKRGLVVRFRHSCLSISECAIIRPVEGSSVNIAERDRDMQRERAMVFAILKKLFASLGSGSPVTRILD